MYTILRENHWLDYKRVGTKLFPLRTPLTALAGNVWGVAGDGGVYGTRWESGQWQEWNRVGDKVFPAGTRLSSLARFVFMELFGVDENGAVFTVQWNNGWQAWNRVGTRVFPANATVEAVRRDTMGGSDAFAVTDIFAVDTNGLVCKATEGNGWGDWNPVGTKIFPQPTAVTAFTQPGFNIADLFAIDDQGGVYGASILGDSQLAQDWTRIGTKAFPAGSRITVVQGFHLTLVVLDADGAVFQSWNDGGWHDWVRIGTTADALPLTTPLTGITHGMPGLPNNLTPELFAVGTDRGIHSTKWAGDWQKWYRIPSTVIGFSKPIESGGVAALGGWAGVNISTDGSVQWYGHAHDSGADGYDFNTTFLVRTTGPYPQTIALSHNGKVTANNRDDDWEEVSASNPLV
ncbi:hypothetical protein, partial [Nocardia brasiliensis]